jgi:hypothetical protein
MYFLGRILEPIFTDQHVVVAQHLQVLQLLELFVVPNMGVIGGQTHQVMDLKANLTYLLHTCAPIPTYET